MKLFAILTFVVSVSVFAQDFETEAANEEILQSNTIQSETIHVDGFVKEKPVEDAEIQSIQQEIRKQKKEIVLNKAKSKQLKVLTKSTEELSDVTEEYLDEKKEAQNQIAEYNAKVKCLQAENPGKECDKYVRRRR